MTAFDNEISLGRSEIARRFLLRANHYRFSPFFTVFFDRGGRRVAWVRFVKMLMAPGVSGSFR
jgi:hypothetical protein